MDAHMICLDLDGTTITHEGVLRPAVREAVQAVLDAGHHVVVATGRGIVATTPILDALGLTKGWTVCSNGAVTVRLDPRAPQGWTLDEDDVVTFDPAPVLTRLRPVLPDALVAVEDLGVGFRLSAPYPPDELVGEQTVVPWEELIAHPTTRVTLRMPEATSEEFAEAVDRAGLHGVAYSVGFSAWLDINPEGVSKGSALEIVRRRLHVEPGLTVAVGDQRNDIEMLRWAARGVAMGNAPTEVQDVADEVTSTVDDDGLVPVLRSLL
ncbi:HAD family hydrolase [Janibacter melonis]|uniref:HAD family hydrolase n=1 Tax=Janibacter melonis TaxID=262209 RepID=UPI001E371781|nr:HAD family hydrolase [Janibacter melonis]MCB5992244.1 Cof-type HAD-IIB family hydrolase [Janibacter melonis]